MSENKGLKEGQLEQVTGGELNQTWKEIVEASRNWLPEGEVTCKNFSCTKSFNAKDNAYGFMHVTNSNGMTETRACAKCQYCGSFWTI